MRLTRIDSPPHLPSRSILPLAFAVLLLVGSASPARAAEPPSNRTYFTIILGLDGKYSWQAECLDFSSADFCTGAGRCGSWTQTESGQNGAFYLEIDLGGEGDPIPIEGRMRFEARGKRDAIGGTAYALVDGREVNLSLTGRATSPRECSRLLETWIVSNQ